MRDLCGAVAAVEHPVVAERCVGAVIVSCPELGGRAHMPAWGTERGPLFGADLAVVRALAVGHVGAVPFNGCSWSEERREVVVARGAGHHRLRCRRGGGGVRGDCSGRGGGVRGGRARGGGSARRGYGRRGAGRLTGVDTVDNLALGASEEKYEKKQLDCAHISFLH